MVASGTQGQLKMRAMVYVFAVIILAVSETWSQNQGTTQITPLKNTSSSLPKVYEFRDFTFNPGDDVNLTCGTKPNSKMVYVIWNIDLNYWKCKIGYTAKGERTDTCKDGKFLKNTSSLHYLHIQNFSKYDVGTYECESVYAGGADSVIFNVRITVSPSTSAWLEWNGTKTVAVCEAERGKPAANISWSHTGNSSLETWQNSDGSFTVKSHLVLLDSINTSNLKCIITHPSWKGEKLWVPKYKQGLILNLVCIVMVVLFIIVLAGFLFFAKKKLTTLRCCWQADTLASKSPPTEDVEEVEPYASYHQRVNSIYNS